MLPMVRSLAEFISTFKFTKPPQLVWKELMIKCQQIYFFLTKLLEMWMSETRMIAVSPQLCSKYKGHETQGGWAICPVKISNLTGKYFENEKSLSCCVGSETYGKRWALAEISKWEVLMLKSLMGREEQEEQRLYLWDETCRSTCVCTPAHTHTRIRTHNKAKFSRQ